MDDAAQTPRFDLDLFADGAGYLASRAAFFAACLMLVIRAPSHFVFGKQP